MKVYVDELPKSCAECEWFTSNHIGDHRNFCLLARMPFYNTKEEREKGRGQHKNGLSDFECPLKPLAEIEKERDANYENYSICWKDNEYLKKQLAEKEEELKEFKSIGATPKQLQRAYQERFKYNERCCELKKQHIQNKINFAVEQLEKVKELGVKDFNLGKGNLALARLIDKINNQIKELKEGKIYE